MVGRPLTGTGVILVVCGSCNGLPGYPVLDFYRIGGGSRGETRKFAGPPTPSKVLSKYDINGPEARCPMCDAPVSNKPRRIEVLSQDEFNQLYALYGIAGVDAGDAGQPMLLVRVAPSEPVAGPVDVHAPGGLAGEAAAQA